MCAQRLLCCQALAERRVSLGVLCGLKYLYRQHGLPLCISGDALSYAATSPQVGELALA